MRCSRCGSENPSDSAFCEQCGQKLELLCPACQAPVGAGARFCRKCGTSLSHPDRSETISTSQSLGAGIRLLAEQTAEVTEGERKTVTALFADLKGSTELMESLDPEEARAIVDPALRIMVEAVRRYEGYVVQSTGDGIFALFGAPAAYEDHSQRGVYAALQMQHGLREYSQGLANQSKPAIEFRVGINTGEVVVRTIETGGKIEYAPIGHTANLASRLQALAPPGSIAVSEHTRTLVEGYFDLRALGPLPIRGINQPVNVYEATGLGPLRTHFQLSIQRGLTKFVGREREIAEMKRALELTINGHGQIVAVTAEPGAGKSRLFFEFKAMLPAECEVLEAYSVSHGRASAWLPVLLLLHNYFRIQGADDPATRRQKVRAALAELDSALLDTEPYLFGLLTIAESPDSLAQMDPQVKRRRTLDALKRILLRESQKRPIVTIFEDLHWIDGETQALLDLLAGGIANTRILLLVNYRPEYHHEWSNKTYYTQLRLEALGQESTAGMLSALLGDAVGLNPLKQLITERADGNPFFIEEMVQALFEREILMPGGVVKVSNYPHDVQLPITVQGVIASRIDRLPGAQKELLRTAAVIGKQFPYQLVRRICHEHKDQLQSLLLNLESVGFIFEDSAPTEKKYHFKHSLTQEVAYGSVLRERRRLLHGLIAAQIEALFAGRLDDHLSELAHHYSRSENAEKAIEYLYLAGRQAARRSANSAAVEYLTAALETTKALPENPERAQRELTIQTTLGPAWMAIKGHAAPEVENVYTRALDLCRRLGEVPEILPVLSALSRFYFQGGDLIRSLELAHSCLRLAPIIPGSGLLAEAHRLVGMNFMFMGKLSQGQEHLETSLKAYHSSMHDWAQLYGSDPEIVCICYLSNLDWLLGFPEKALRRSKHLMTLAQAKGHYLNIAGAWHFAAFVHQARGEAQQCQDCAESGIALSSQQGFTLFSAFSTIDQGWAMAQQLGNTSGLEIMRTGIAAYRSTGGRVFLPYFLWLLAETCVKHGRLEEASELLTEALAESDRSSAHWWDAELQRTRGDVLSKGSDRQGAESCFLDAINTARNHESKALELRATISLAELLGDLGRREEALTMLNEIYNWFTEGFDTTDLKEAKALIDDLSS
jgi:class 3 adenylate cyclase/predicted ATPase/ribosomal protein L40E